MSFGGGEVRSELTATSFRWNIFYGYWSKNLLLQLGGRLFASAENDEEVEGGTAKNYTKPRRQRGKCAEKSWVEVLEASIVETQWTFWVLGAALISKSLDSFSSIAFLLQHNNRASHSKIHYRSARGEGFRLKAPPGIFIFLVESFPFELWRRKQKWIGELQEFKLIFNKNKTQSFAVFFTLLFTSCPSSSFPIRKFLFLGNSSPLLRCKSFTIGREREKKAGRRMLYGWAGAWVGWQDRWVRDEVRQWFAKGSTLSGGETIRDSIHALAPHPKMSVKLALSFNSRPRESKAKACKPPSRIKTSREDLKSF